MNDKPMIAAVREKLKQEIDRKNIYHNTDKEFQASLQTCKDILAFLDNLEEGESSRGGGGDGLIDEVMKRFTPDEICDFIEKARPLPQSEVPSLDDFSYEKLQEFRRGVTSQGMKEIKYEEFVCEQIEHLTTALQYCLKEIELIKSK